MLNHVFREHNKIADALTKNVTDCITLLVPPATFAKCERFTFHFDGSHNNTTGYSSCAWVCLGVTSNQATVYTSSELEMLAIGSWELPNGTSAVNAELVAFSSALDIAIAISRASIVHHTATCVAPMVP